MIRSRQTLAGHSHLEEECHKSVLGSSASSMRVSSAGRTWSPAAEGVCGKAQFFFLGDPEKWRCQTVNHEKSGETSKEKSYLLRE